MADYPRRPPRPLQRRKKTIAEELGVTPADVRARKIILSKEAPLDPQPRLKFDEPVFGDPLFPSATPKPGFIVKRPPIGLGARSQGVEFKAAMSDKGIIVRKKTLKEPRKVPRQTIRSRLLAARG